MRDCRGAARRLNQGPSYGERTRDEPYAAIIEIPTDFHHSPQVTPAGFKLGMPELPKLWDCGRVPLPRGWKTIKNRVKLAQHGKQGLAGKVERGL